MNFNRLFQTALLLICFALPLQAQREPEIIICAKAGDLGCVKKNVKKDKNSLFAADAQGNTVLIAAAARGANSIISFVVQHWPDWRTNDNGSNPLHAAVAAGHADTVNLIIAYVKDDPDINFERFINAKDTQNGATPLHLAAARCNAQLYSYLISQGAQENVMDFEGRTPKALLARCKKSKPAPAAAKNTSKAPKAKPASAPASAASETPAL